MFVLRHSVTCCVADEIQRFMEEVKSLSYEDKPPYEKLRSILKAGLKAVQAKDDGKLEFTPVNGAVPPPAKVSTHTLTHTHTNTLKQTTTLIVQGIKRSSNDLLRHSFFFFFWCYCNT